MEDDYDVSTIFFPGFDPETREYLVKIMDVTSDVCNNFLILKVPLSIIAIVLNIAHFLVLTRKSIMNNSINFILAVLALNDIFGMSLILLYEYYDSIIRNYDCVPYDRLYSNIVYLTMTTFRNFSRRNSSWLAIIMAAIRTLCISNFQNSLFTSLTTIKYGFYAVLFELIISLSISSLIPFPFLVNKPLWKPGEEQYEWVQQKSCEGYPILANQTEHSLNYSDDDLIQTTIIDTITINVIPSLFYPILTFFLVRTFRAAKLVRKRVGKENQNDRSTVIVLTMTISFMIAEIPQAIAYFIEVLGYKKPGFVAISELIMRTFLNLSLLNSSIHCVICFALSSVYRNDVFKILRIRKTNMLSAIQRKPLRTIPMRQSSTAQ